MTEAVKTTTLPKKRKHKTHRERMEAMTPEKREAYRLHKNEMNRIYRNSKTPEEKAELRRKCREKYRESHPARPKCNMKHFSECLNCTLPDCTTDLPIRACETQLMREAHEGKRKKKENKGALDDAEEMDSMQL